MTQICRVYRKNACFYSSGERIGKRSYALSRVLWRRGLITEEHLGRRCLFNRSRRQNTCCTLASSNLDSAIEWRETTEGILSRLEDTLSTLPWAAHECPFVFMWHLMFRCEERVLFQSPMLAQAQGTLLSSSFSASVSRVHTADPRGTFPPSHCGQQHFPKEFTSPLGTKQRYRPCNIYDQTQVIFEI